MLLTGNCERVVEISFGFRGVRPQRFEGDFRSNSVALGFDPFLGHLDCVDCFGKAVPSVVELVKFRISAC